MATRGAKQIERVRATAHEGFLRHRNFRWLKVGLLLSILAIVGYSIIDVYPRHNGGSWYGYTLGTIGALLILWLTLLGVRKRAMTRGAWSLKGWTSAHVYLGLSLIVIGTLHTGFQFGWNVHTLAYALMMLVIASGIYGIAVYSTLPDELSDNRSAMTKSQMIDVITKLDRQLQVAAQPLTHSDTEIVRRSLKEDPFRAGLFRRLSGSDRGCRNATHTTIERKGGGKGKRYHYYRCPKRPRHGVADSCPNAGHRRAEPLEDKVWGSSPGCSRTRRGCAGD